MILVYITCEDKIEAEKIGKHLLKKRLVACVNIIDSAHSMYFWPPSLPAGRQGKNRIEEASEAILLCKTLESKWNALEKHVLKLHSYSNPMIYAIPISCVTKKYYNWLTSELKITT